HRRPSITRARRLTPPTMTFGRVRLRGRPWPSRYSVRPFMLQAVMRPSIPVAVLLIATLAACGGQAPASSSSNGLAAAAQAHTRAVDAGFAALSARYLDEALAYSPVAATQIG